MNEIAIASVPIQDWEQPLDEREAFFQGSIFRQLNKPFYAETQTADSDTNAADRDSCGCEPICGCTPVCGCEPADAGEAKLLEIQQATFFLIDLTLFLDTHPDHIQAKQLKQQYQQKRKELMEQFAAEFYPLTMDCQGDAKEEAVPWDKGGNAHVAL